MVVGRTDDVRCGGFNWKNKDRGEQKHKRKIKKGKWKMVCAHLNLA